MNRSSTSTLSVSVLVCSILLDVFVLLPLLVIATPWLLFKVLGEGRGFGDLRDRVGLWQISLPVRPRIWIHAASVGEVHAAKSLLVELQQAHPGKEFILTTMTTGARDLARKIIPDVEVRLLPIPLGHFLFSMVRKMRPTTLVLIELEYWPQLLLACKAYSIPVTVVNGRISDHGLRQWNNWMPFIGWMARIPELILARSEEDSDRFIAIGTPAEKVRVGGNLKYDFSTTGVFAKQRSPGQPFTWIAGCTHLGEEGVVLEVHRKLLAEHRGSKCYLAPRHIERCTEVQHMVEQAGFSCQRWSEASQKTSAEIIIIDRLGVLGEAYSLAEAAFVGGSLVDRGGHNFLEPVLAGCFTCHGPHIGNFRDMEQLLNPWNVVDQVADPAELTNWILARAASRELFKERQIVTQELQKSLGGISRRCVNLLRPWFE